MRVSLQFIFWLCVVGTILRVPLLGYELWLIATVTSFSDLTFTLLFGEYLAFLAWVPHLITAVFGSELGTLILELPATLVTIVKLTGGTLVGYWIQATLRRMDASSPSDGLVHLG